MKRILSLVLVLMLCLPLVSAMAEEEKVLNIFTWEYYIDDETRNYAIDGVVTHWMPLPQPPKGE